MQHIIWKHRAYAYREEYICTVGHSLMSVPRCQMWHRAWKHKACTCREEYMFTGAPNIDAMTYMLDVGQCMRSTTQVLAERNLYVQCHQYLWP